MQNLSIQEVRARGRVTRKPSHPFTVRHKPWEIQPFFIAPVLPGETMKNLLLQSRVVSDPIKNPLIGWWLEYYFFYVKLRDLASWSTVYQQMLLDPGYVWAGASSAAAAYYHQANGAEYVKECLSRVVEKYFRQEGEAWNGWLSGQGMPMAKINSETWTDSMVADSAYYRPDVNVDLNANATITASEVDKALQQWQWLRSNGISNMSYQDFLRSYGVSVPKEIREETNEPELVRYIREWSYPTNTVDPTSGAPSSAMSWSVTERADKDRFFKEPGFLFGATVARPKVYLGAQASSLVDYMTNATHWLPAVLRGDPLTSMQKFAAGAGPISGQTGAYWVDMKDLFLYGEQFTNVLSATDINKVALPTAAGQKRYAAQADIDALFKSTAAELVKQDGICNLTILGALDDTTGTV